MNFVKIIKVILFAVFIIIYGIWPDPFGPFDEIVVSAILYALNQKLTMRLPKD